jgi:hypothetical protein
MSFSSRGGPNRHNRIANRVFGRHASHGSSLCPGDHVVSLGEPEENDFARRNREGKIMHDVKARGMRDCPQAQPRQKPPECDHGPR